MNYQSLPYWDFVGDHAPILLGDDFTNEFYGDAYWDDIGMSGAYNSTATCERAIMMLHGALSSEVE